MEERFDAKRELIKQPMNQPVSNSDERDLQQSSCPLCAGSGWKMIVANNGREKAVKCDCRIRSWAARLLRQARIPPHFEDCSLSNFDANISGPDSTVAKALLDALHYVEQYPIETTRGLLLRGPIGVGKTHLAVGIIRALMVKKSVPCLFFDYRELLKLIQNSYNDSVHITEFEILKPIFETEVLVLDELGAVRTTEWVWDTVNYILNTRYNQNKTTIITTNLQDAPPGATRTPEFDKLAASRRDAEDAMRGITLGDRIGERMRSRLQEMCIKIEIDGNDVRLTKSKSSRFHAANVQFRLSRKKNSSLQSQPPDGS